MTLSEDSNKFTTAALIKNNKCYLKRNDATEITHDNLYPV